MWFSTSRVARQEKVTPQMVRRWISEGHYDKYEVTKGRHYRVRVLVNPDHEFE